MRKDWGHAEGNGRCCVYQLQRVHCHPKLGFGGGEGSISRFPVSQDLTDPLLRGSTVLHVNSDAEHQACTGLLLGKPAVLESKRSHVGPCVPGKSQGFALLGARLHEHKMSFSQGVTCWWLQHRPKVSFVCQLAFALDLFPAGCVGRCGQFREPYPGRDSEGRFLSRCESGDGPFGQGIPDPLPRCAALGQGFHLRACPLGNVAVAHG